MAEKPFRDAARERAGALRAWSAQIAKTLHDRGVKPERILRFHVFGDMRPLHWWERIGWQPNDLDLVPHSGWVLIEGDFDREVGDSDGTPNYEPGRRGLLLTTNAELISYEMPNTMKATLSRKDRYEQKIAAMVKTVDFREDTAIVDEDKRGDVGSFFWLDPTHGPLITLSDLETALGTLARRLNAL